MITRRQFLRGIGGVALVGGTGALSLLKLGPAAQTGALLRSQTPLPPPFRVPLPIPDIARAIRRDGGVDHFEIVQRPADLEILPGRLTRIWGYDGTFPGPTFRARTGQPVDVRFRNELSVGTVIHLHGGRTPPDSDGYPTDVILPAKGSSVHLSMPGDTTVGHRDYRYPLDQRAATLWYHDHTMDFTGPNVYRGLAGFFIIDDDEDASLPLPRGDRDIPLMLCDRAFDSDAQFRYPALSPSQDRPGVEHRYMGGVLGDVTLVNGAPWPVHDVAAVRYRLRFLNASNARRYDLRLHPEPLDGPGFIQIGTDGGLLDRPLPRRSIRLAPAERADVIVDFASFPVGTDVTVRNLLGEHGNDAVLRFHVARTASDDSVIPARLSVVEALDPAAASRTRTFHFQLRNLDLDAPAGGNHQDTDEHRWMINGHVFDPDLDLASPRFGDVEIWRFMTDLHHPVHVHLVHFQVLARNSRSPGDGDRGWKDTIDLIPGETAEVVARFDGYRGRYVMHCHNLEHEDMSMMANFTVTGEPGK